MQQQRVHRILDLPGERDGSSRRADPGRIHCELKDLWCFRIRYRIDEDTPKRVGTPPIVILAPDREDITRFARDIEKDIIDVPILHLKDIHETGIHSPRPGNPHGRGGFIEEPRRIIRGLVRNYTEPEDRILCQGDGEKIVLRAIHGIIHPVVTSHQITYRIRTGCQDIVKGGLVRFRSHTLVTSLDQCNCPVGGLGEIGRITIGILGDEIAVRSVNAIEIPERLDHIRGAPGIVGGIVDPNLRNNGGEHGGSNEKQWGPEKGNNTFHGRFSDKTLTGSGKRNGPQQLPEPGQRLNIFAVLTLRLLRWPMDPSGQRRRRRKSPRQPNRPRSGAVGSGMGSRKTPPRALAFHPSLLRPQTVNSSPTSPLIWKMA